MPKEFDAAEGEAASPAPLERRELVSLAGKIAKLCLQGLTGGTQSCWDEVPSLVERYARGGGQLSKISWKSLGWSDKPLLDIVATADKRSARQLVADGLVPWASWPMAPSFQAISAWGDCPRVGVEERAAYALLVGCVSEYRMMVSHSSRMAKGLLAYAERAGGDPEGIERGISRAKARLGEMLANPNTRFEGERSRFLLGALVGFLGSERGVREHSAIAGSRLLQSGGRALAAPWQKACLGALEDDSALVLRHLLAGMAAVGPTLVSAPATMDVPRGARNGSRPLTCGLLGHAMRLGAFACVDVLIGAGCSSGASLTPEGAWVQDCNPFELMRGALLRQAKSKAGPEAASRAFHAVGRLMAAELVAAGNSFERACELVEAAAMMGDRHMSKPASKSLYERLLLSQPQELARGRPGAAPEEASAGPRRL